MSDDLANQLDSRLVDLAESKRQVDEQLLRANEAIAELDQEKTKLADQVRAYETFYSEHEAGRAETSAAKEQLEKDLTEAQATAQVHAKQLERAAEREQVLAKQVSALQSDAASMAGRVELLDEQVTALKLTASIAEKQIGELSEANANLQHRLDESEARASESATQLADLHAEYEKLNLEKTTLEESSVHQASMLEQGELRAIEATTAGEEANRSRQEMAERLSATQTELVSATRSQEDLQASLSSAQQSSRLVMEALLATIQDEWGSVGTWELHVHDMQGMPKALSAIVSALKALEAETAAKDDESVPVDSPAKELVS